jgi:oxygen-dependent protoporphyrinogen oxidase
MGQPIAALHAELGHEVVRCNAPVARLEPGTPHRVHLADGEVFEADAVVLTVPAPAMSQLLRGVADDAAQALSEIPVAGVHVVCLGYRRDQIGESVEGFGALIPRQEKIRILGSIFSSSTFDGRAPKGFTLLTNMIGGRHDPAANDLSDEELEAAVRRDVSALLHIDGDPVFARVFRWARGIPQYEIGHLDRVARARDDVAKVGGIFLGGNSVAGVSFNQCIAHAEELAGQVCDRLGDGLSTQETHS